jgi:hypothetical protein
MSDAASHRRFSEFCDSPLVALSAAWLTFLYLRLFECCAGPGHTLAMRPAGLHTEGVIGGKTARLEYLYLDFGTVSGTLNSTAVAGGGAGTLASNFSSRVTDNIVRVGLNFTGPEISQYSAHRRFTLATNSTSIFAIRKARGSADRTRTPMAC